MNTEQTSKNIFMHIGNGLSYNIMAQINNLYEKNNEKINKWYMAMLNQTRLQKIGKALNYCGFKLLVNLASPDLLLQVIPV